MTPGAEYISSSLIIMVIIIMLHKSAKCDTGSAKIVREVVSIK